ncbi:hypothetical protein VC83_06082 [Pseudogymnoascus destructans]|uniref:Uncharacterized protein n=1 Tax=Pseudogymnoascus destructans TaxID=655981 RepID=A0A177AAI5_9PEZI|nr:uncharacterized protein VC83_06084 [Pseudogymnoascus destructans]XP_024324056.1 uncharacterized protein VC83_06082 [Pseudogymnoascus destructans]OAF58770.1 hypothetical protein VC83_06084 [Pseudogymnoascus destructans]OAF58772.1 hypothetical protein VC83_06082 [Pseudogymnoascus destructans]
MAEGQVDDNLTSEMKKQRFNAQRNVNSENHESDMVFKEFMNLRSLWAKVTQMNRTKLTVEEKDKEIEKLKACICDNMHQSQKEMEELVCSFEEIIETEAVESLRLINQNQMLKKQRNMAEGVDELA